MQEFVNVYEKNQIDIEKFLITTLRHSGELLGQEKKHFKQLFETFPSMELIYIADEDFIQTSDNILKNKKNTTARNADRNYMFARLRQIDDEFYISTPYISSATGKTCVTVMKHEKDQNIFIDFRLSALLGRLGLVEINPTFNTYTKFFYKSVGFSLMAFAYFAILYALVGYAKNIVIDHIFTLDTLFKPIVALTLGLAIFDLAKTILEREVFFKNYAKDDEDSNVLTKFSIAIIIALSIEALMVVFKIALHDYSQMIHAFYLIAGIGIIIISLGLYAYLTKKAK